MKRTQGEVWMKKLPVTVGILVALVVGVVLAKNVIAKTAIMGGVKAMTGLDLQIRGMQVGLLKRAVGVQGLILKNPSGFSDPVMMDLPDIYVAYDLGAFLTHKIHLQEVRLHMKEFNVIRDQQGRLNLDALKVVQESKGKTLPPRQAPQPAPEMLVDTLHLQIGKVVYKDYSRGGKPVVQEFPINLDEQYTHITSPQSFAALIVSRALMRTSLARLTNINLASLQSLVQNPMGSVTQAVGMARSGAAAGVNLVTGGAKSATQGATKAGQEAVGAFEDTATSLKKSLLGGQ